MLLNAILKEYRMMLLPPLSLVMQLLNFTQPVPYDVIHVFGPLCLAFIPILPLFYLRSVKIYVSYHVFLEFYKNVYLGSSHLTFLLIEFLFSLTYFIPFTFFADIVGIPSKTADNLVFRYSKRIHVMKSGLNTNVFKPLEELHQEMQEKPWSHLTKTSHLQDQGPTLIYVGRLAGEKNVEFLIKSLAHPEMQGATLVLVGDGPSRKSLQKLAAHVVGPSNVYFEMDKEHLNRSDSVYTEDGFTMNACKPNRVVFTGMILLEDVVASHYAHADVFVSASASETFGFTVAEAMACGIPAVVVRSGAFANVYKAIDHWMFEEENLDDFVSHVHFVLKQGQGAKEMARRIAVERFGVDFAIRDLLTTYVAMVDGNLSKYVVDQKME